MKKVLLASSALALVGSFASPAAAAEWNMRVGGYMTQAVGFADVDADFSGEFDGVDVYSDTEIHFVPSITLDNGIQFGANIQLEGNTSGDQIDESYMFIKGSFGEVLIGSENSAGYKMRYGPPNPGILGINSGTFSAWIPFSTGGDQLFRGTLGTTALEVSTNNDSQRITYFTPRFSGFQLGASYARDGEQDSSGAVDTDGALHDIFDIGANYVNSFGDANVALSGRWGTANDNDGSDSSIWSIGTQVGFSGFTVGGAYAEQNGAGVRNGRAWSAGVAYATGPWAIGVEYFNGKNRGNGDGEAASVGIVGGVPAVIPSTLTPESGDEKLEQFLVQITYSVGAGVSVSAYGAWADFDDADGGVTKDDIDGFVIGTGIALSF